MSAAIAGLALPRQEDPRAALAETAVWLALANLGPRAAQELAALGIPPGADALVARVGVGVLLQRCAADVLVGAAERALCALASVALGCADPATGRELQPGLGGLRLLEIVEQIPVAAQIRLLLLEFRHLRLAPEVPAAFLARVEDLLERFDVERLTGARLEDRAPPPREDALARVQAARSKGLAREPKPRSARQPKAPSKPKRAARRAR